MTPTVNYLVEEGPLFERMREWAQLRVEFAQNLQSLAKEFGADPDRVRWSDWENRVLGFWFDRDNEPKHWKQRDTHGCSLPHKANTQAWKKFVLFPLRRSRSIFWKASSAARSASLDILLWGSVTFHLKARS